MGQAFEPSVPAATNLVNDNGVTGLHIAAESSDVELCALLMRFEAFIDAQELEEGATPLMYGLRSHSSMETIKFLLRAAAEPTRCDRSGGQALHYAAAAGDSSVGSLSLLLSAQAA